MCRLKHVPGTDCILVLPIGYYAGTDDSSDVRPRFAGGTGRYGTVIQSCDEPPAYQSDRFADVGALTSLYAFRLLHEGMPIVSQYGSYTVGLGYGGGGPDLVYAPQVDGARTGPGNLNRGC